MNYTDLDNIAISIVSTTVRRHSSVMSKSKPMSHLVAKAVVPKSTSLPNCSDCVARRYCVEIIDSTDSTAGVLIDKKNGGICSLANSVQVVL